MKSASCTLILSLAVFFIFGCHGDTDGLTGASDRFDFSPSSCDPEAMAASPLHAKHLRFARLLAISLGQSEALRQAVKTASVAPSQEYFNEILVGDFLSAPLANSTVDGLFGQVFSSDASLSEGQSYGTFKSELLTADPLLVIKIPDWLWDTVWNIQQTAPHVVSNMKGQGQLLYGFEASGNCFSKESYFEFANYEIVVKTSEDYLWIENQDLLEGFAHPCMSYAEFFNTYARSYAGHWLLKKRDMQNLFLACAPTAPDGPPAPPPSPCLRDEGFDRNYLLGFQLANEGVMSTLNNQPCLGGEETFDFQIDFLYSARTEEAAALDAKLPPLALYGLRRKDLVDIKYKKPGFLITGIEVIPKYYSVNLGVAPQKFDYMAQISPNQPEWVVDKFGGEIYVTWNETDFEVCTSTNVTTVTNTVGLTLNLGLMFEWFSKAQNPNSTFNTGYTRISQHTVQVTGASVIPLGFNALGYCNPPTPGVPPAVWYPTGPQGLLVHYNYVLD